MWMANCTTILNMYTVDVLGGERERQRFDLLIIFMSVCRQFNVRVVSVWRRTLQDAGTVILQRASRWPAGPEGFSSKANGEWVSAAEDWMNLFFILNSLFFFFFFSCLIFSLFFTPSNYGTLGLGGARGFHDYGYTREYIRPSCIPGFPRHIHLHT